MFDKLIQSDELQKTFLTCGLGEEVVALPVSRVKEILDPKPITGLPHSPDFLLGYIDLRGESIMVADLRLLLALPYRDNEPDTRIIVLWVQQGDTQTAVGLRADRVIEVTRLDEDRLETFDQKGLLNWDNRMVQGVGRRDGGFVTVLNLDGMMSSKVIKEFHAATSSEEAA